ncbi:MAG: DUF504 domain-containing protein [Thermoplasmata archaeon]|nr:DUF504 domain-containing protein [Thermoplasmata archaeon]
MPSAHEILNELKWREDRDLDRAEIWYIHRGAPNDTMIIKGSEIIELQRSFMKLEEAMIPYHRILKIVYENKAVWEKKIK